MRNAVTGPGIGVLRSFGFGERHGWSVASVDVTYTDDLHNNTAAQTVPATALHTWQTLQDMCIPVHIDT